MNDEGKKQELQDIDLADLDKVTGGWWDNYGNGGGDYGYGYGAHDTGGFGGGMGNQVLIDNGGWYW